MKLGFQVVWNREIEYWLTSFCLIIWSFFNKDFQKTNPAKCPSSDTPIKKSKGSKRALFLKLRDWECGGDSHYLCTCKKTDDAILINQPYGSAVYTVGRGNLYNSISVFTNKSVAPHPVQCTLNVCT